MNIILTVGILLIIVAYLTRNSKNAVLIGFAFVFLIIGFQSNVKGDYVQYMQYYDLISRTDKVSSRTIADEPFWPYLMYFFSLFGSWRFFVIILSAFECGVLVRFVKRYGFGPYLYISSILFFFTFNMMLLQMKAMRQGLAIELMVLAFILIGNRQKRWWSIVVTICAYYTHNAMLMVLPFFILYYVYSVKPIWIKKLAIFRIREKGDLRDYNMPILLVVVYYFIYIIKFRFLDQYFLPVILLTRGELNDRLAGYAEGTNKVESLEANLFDISPLIVLYDGIIVFLVALYFRKANTRMKIFCLISILAAFGDMLLYGAGTFPRMIMFYVVFNLVVYPAVALYISKRYGFVFAMVFVVLLIGYAIKTSLAWITDMSPDRFGNYNFQFF